MIKNLFLFCHLFCVSLTLLAQSDQIRFSKTYGHLYGGEKKDARYNSWRIASIPTGYIVSGIDPFGLNPVNSDPQLYNDIQTPGDSDYTNLFFFTDLNGNAIDTIFYKGRCEKILYDSVRNQILCYGDRHINSLRIGQVLFINTDANIFKTLLIPGLRTITSVIALPDSSYLAFDGGLEISANPAAEDRKIYYAKISQNGDLLWTKEYLPDDPTQTFWPSEVRINSTSAVLLNDSTVAVQYFAGITFTAYGYITMTLEGNVLSDQRAFSRQQNADYLDYYWIAKKQDGKLVSLAPRQIPDDPQGFLRLAAPVAGLDENFTAEWIYINQYQKENIKTSLAVYKMYDLLVRKDGTILACGLLVDSFYTTDSTYIDRRPTPVLLGLSNDGEYLWQKYIEPEVLGGGALLGMTETHDGGLILTGVKHFLPTGGYTSPWVLKLDKDYCLEPGCKDSSILYKAPVIPIDTNYYGDISINPNPARGWFELKLNKTDLARIDRIIVYNALGQLVLEQNITESSTNISLSPMAAGTYFVQLVSSAGLTVFTKKILNIGP